VEGSPGRRKYECNDCEKNGALKGEDHFPGTLIPSLQSPRTSSGIHETSRFLHEQRTLWRWCSLPPQELVQQHCHLQVDCNKSVNRGRDGFNSKNRNLFLPKTPRAPSGTHSFFDRYKSLSISSKSSMVSMMVLSKRAMASNIILRTISEAMPQRGRSNCDNLMYCTVDVLWA